MSKLKVILFLMVLAAVMYAIGYGIGSLIKITGG